MHHHHTTMSYTRHLLRFDQISTTQLYDTLQLRNAIFIVEQACAYADIDGRDMHPDAHHLLYYGADSTLLAYARLLPVGLAYAQPSIGRVIVAPAQRGQGLAHRLLADAVACCQQIWPDQPAISLGAQHHLQHFYAQHGFMPVGETYLEDGIAHIDMQRPMFISPHSPN